MREKIRDMTIRFASLVLFAAICSSADASEGASEGAKTPSFRDQVSEIEQAPDGRYRVRFQQRGVVYTVEEKDKSGVQCLMRSVKLLKDVNVQFDPETRKVVGCDVVVPK